MSLKTLIVLHFEHTLQKQTTVTHKLITVNHVAQNVVSSMHIVGDFETLNITIVQAQIYMYNVSIISHKIVRFFRMTWKPGPEEGISES